MILTFTDKFGFQFKRLFCSSGELLIILRYALSSSVGLVALTTASLVDGFFIGNALGAEALAAINYLIPLFSASFAIVLMIAIGGSIGINFILAPLSQDQGSDGLRRNCESEGGGLFSACLLSALLVAVGIALLVLFATPTLLSYLDLPTTIHEHIQTYLSVWVYILPPQFLGVVLYYFLRARAKPQLAAIALVLGAFVNIILDYVFLVKLSWGLEAAAWATVFAQSLQLTFLVLIYLRRPPVKLWVWPRYGQHFFKSVANGSSEFVCEVSVGLVIAFTNSLAYRHFGVQGLALISVVNYLIFAHVMAAYGLVEAQHVLISRYSGEKQWLKALRTRNTCVLLAFTWGLASAIFVLYFKGPIITWFLPLYNVGDGRAEQTLFVALACLFLLLSPNISFTAFLSARQYIRLSFLASLARSLLLPCLLLWWLGFLLQSPSFLWSLPLAELISTFFVVLVYLKLKDNGLYKD